jgi:predicted nucleic acid-binding protein
MILLDVNVLIYAFRGDLPQHALCRAWLAGVVMSDPALACSHWYWIATRRGSLDSYQSSD